MIESRLYNVNGSRWEARFFRKGECFPDTDIAVPRQGVWARPADKGWEGAVFAGVSWRFVRMDADVLYMPER